MRKADADTPRAEAEGGRESGAQAAEGLIERTRTETETVPELPAPFSPQCVSHPERGANELQELSITSPEPAAIGWPSRRAGCCYDSASWFWACIRGGGSDRQNHVSTSFQAMVGLRDP